MNHIYVDQVNDDHTSIIRQARRTHKDYGGRGIITKLETFLLGEVRKVYPRVVSVVSVSDSGHYSDVNIRSNRVNLDHRQYIGIIDTSKTLLQKRCATYKKCRTAKVLDINEFHSLIKTEVIAELFPHKYFLALTSFIVFPTTVTGIRDACKQAATLYTVDDGTQMVNGLSFANCTFIEIGAYYTFHMHCTDAAAAEHHVIKHLQEAARVCPPGMRIFFRAIFTNPDHVPVVNKIIADGFGKWIPNQIPRQEFVIHEKPLNHKL